MKQVLTAKLKLQPAPEQFQAFRQTQLAYRDALNYVSRYSFAHGKKSNQQWLQRECYDEFRVRFGLPAQMACNVPRQVGATYKGLWTKARKNAQQRKAGLTRKRYKGLAEAPQYVSPTLTYNFHRDYSLLLVSFEVEVTDPTPQNHTRIVGVDVGQRYLAVVARLDTGASFFSGKAVRAKADHYARLRKRLQINPARARWCSTREEEGDL